jgi:hypothetical protein
MKPNPAALAACVENARLHGCAYPPAVEASMGDVLERALDLAPAVAPLYEVVLRRFPDVRPLPAGWLIRWDPDQELHYFTNGTVTQWERPSSGVVTSSSKSTRSS